MQSTPDAQGKAERVLFTIQQDFQAGLRLPGPGAASLQELNAKFSLWLQSVYHTRVHSGTGMTPTERYQRGAHLVKALDPHLDLDQLFDHQLTRTVRRDGTVRLGHHLYEVDLSLRTLTVQLRFDPFKLDRIEVSYRGTAFGLAKAVNAPLNSQIQEATLMKNAPNLELSLWARQWGATAVPFGEPSTEAWLGDPAKPARPDLAGPNGHAAQRHAAGRSQRGG